MFSEGIEQSLNAWGTGMKVTGAIAAVVCVGIAGSATRSGRHDEWAENGLDWGYLTLALVLLVSGFASGTLWHGFADVVRLLKKQAGLPFSGSLMQSAMVSYDVCSDCKTTVDADNPTCPSCEATFEF